MDYRDYLIRQHQQERMAQQVDALFTRTKITLPLQRNASRTGVLRSAGGGRRLR
jgi:hypothetical protein